MTKLSKADHDILTRALTMYERSTGESAVHIASQVQVANPEQDKKEEAERKQREYDAQAQRTAGLEKHQQMLRQAEAARTSDQLQPGNPGPGEGALATERAKASGHRQGEVGKNARLP